MKNNAIPQHLLTMKALDRSALALLLQRAEKYHRLSSKKKTITHCLREQIVTHLFLEPSTRTHYSFDLAAKRLGAITIDPQLNFSSLVKGESLTDTIQAFVAMGTDIFIIRQSDEQFLDRLSQQIGNTSVIINAGDGRNQHPTQALTDLFTIQQFKPNWSSLRVAIIGDIRHSRVANSLIDGLVTMGVKQIQLIAPPSFLPNSAFPAPIQSTSSVSDGLADCDVIVCLRIQKERMSQTDFPDIAQFHQAYGLTAERLRLAKPDAIVMHPSPMNRGIEIASDVADGKQSVIFQQIQNSIAVRMAILDIFSQ